jgi:hypothetical protein
MGHQGTGCRQSFEDFLKQPFPGFLAAFEQPILEPDE